MTKIISIFLPDVLRKRGGGPSTYLYNLKLGLENIGKKISENKIKYNDLEINFVTAGTKENINEVSPDIKDSLVSKNQKLYRFIKKIFENNSLLYFLWSIYFRLKKILAQNKELLNNSDIIWFHDPISIFYILPKLNKKPKVILTFQSPDDLIEELKNVSKTQFKNSLITKIIFPLFPFNKFKKIADSGIEKANFYIYPCKEALEVHIKTNTLIDKIFKTSPEKFLYCLTGVPPLNITIDSNSLRKKLGFYESDFLVLFVGRHNEYKGFDLLYEAVKELSKDIKNIYLISAGKGWMAEEYKKDKNNEFWRYLGFIENVGDFINMCNIHCIPNRESFFDIGLIESLSIGKPIITTYTGGHRWFHNQSKGILLVKPDKEEIKKAILEIKNKTKDELNQMIYENKKLYEDYFSLKKFALEVINVLQKI